MNPSLTFAAAALAAAVTVAAPILQDDPAADNHRHPHAAERVKERVQGKAQKAPAAAPASAAPAAVSAAAPRTSDGAGPALQVSPSAAGAVINRKAGNTPNLADFSTTFAQHPHQAGYNATEPDQMFLETFRPLCPSGQSAVSGNFRITVKLLQTGASNDALAFWDGPAGPVFNTHLWQPTDTAGTVKTLNFNLASLPPTGSPWGYNQSPSGPVINSPPGNPANGLSLLSDGDFSFSVQDDTAVLDASLEYACRSTATDRKGMTWGVYPDHPVSGVTTVSCQGLPGGNCNAYAGDTPGSTALPVLCVFPANQPLPASMAGHPSAAYWSGDILATTPAVSPAGAGLTTRTAVNAYCASQFGPGWKVAEFHMGANLGWKFAAYGHVGPAGASRFWVDINDQPNANYWQ